jgi:hypothetical protein
MDMVDPYAQTQILGHERHGPQVLGFDNLQEAVNAQLNGKVVDLGQKVDALIGDHQVTMSLAQDLVMRQGRTEVALNTLTGFVKTNCELVQNVVSREAEHNAKKQIAEAVLGFLVAINFIMGILIVAKVY